MRKVLSSFGAALFFLSIALSTVACGDADIGESCEEEGRVSGECVEDAVCGKKDGSLVCLKQCSTIADCAGNETCGAVGGTTVRACRPTPP